MAFLSQGDLLTQPLVAALCLLAGELMLFTGEVVALLRLLASLFKLLAADADLPQGHARANSSAEEDEQGS